MKKPKISFPFIIKKFVGKKKKFKGWKVQHRLIWKPERHKCHHSIAVDLKRHRKNPPYWFSIEDDEIIAFDTIHSPYNKTHIILKLADPEFFEKLEKLLIERA